MRDKRQALKLLRLNGCFNWDIETRISLMKSHSAKVEIVKPSATSVSQICVSQICVSQISFSQICISQIVFSQMGISSTKWESHQPKGNICQPNSGVAGV
jgi:hypothetical protein